VRSLAGVKGAAPIEALPAAILDDDAEVPAGLSIDA
jgi:hypothetical protein